MNNINQRHNLFVNYYLNNGRNALQAYKLVYPNVNDKTAQANASRLLSKAIIQEIIAIEDAKITEKFQITRESMANLLLSCIEDCKEAGDRKNLISAVTTLNKMYGLNSADKVELEAKGIIINYVAPKE